MIQHVADDEHKIYLISYIFYLLADTYIHIWLHNKFLLFYFFYFCLICHNASHQKNKMWYSNIFFILSFIFLFCVFFFYHLPSSFLASLTWEIAHITQSNEALKKKQAKKKLKPSHPSITSVYYLANSVVSVAHDQNHLKHTQETKTNRRSSCLCCIYSCLSLYHFHSLYKIKPNQTWNTKCKGNIYIYILGTQKH